MKASKNTFVRKAPRKILVTLRPLCSNTRWRTHLKAECDIPIQLSMNAKNICTLGLSK